VADAAALAGPDADAALDDENTVLGSWGRDWGLVVPAGNPADVTGLASLVDDDVTFANRDAESGLRTRLDAALEDLAADRENSMDAVTEAISGYELATRGHESPARRVADGVVDVGLGLESTADRPGLGFVPLGTDRVAVVAAQDRRDKPGVRDLERALDSRDECDHARAERDED
jgi:putative molybdopterin biosynthesis protein